MIKRILIRTLILAVITAAAFAVMEPLTVATGWPEAMQCTKALAVLAWAEHSIMIVRLAMQPRIDVQAAATLRPDEDGNVDQRAGAALYAVHQATWAVRLVAFLVLYGGL